MTWSVRFEEVSKRYRGGGPRYPSLRLDVASAFSGLRDRLVRRPVAPQGLIALDRVSFQVEQGESFAIIGPNGAGKTTALKVISRITYPTAGRVRVRGRVGALIEVGSGVHPELTARENIWLFGQILGMSKADVRREFDAIVDFAEVAHVLDTPVKMYSSGMQLRLGFAIASHLDPDVFVVDEALAVGDAAFQLKCVERMTKLVRESRTLLFVSHDLPIIEATCRRALFLLDGRVVTEGPVREVLGAYITWVDEGRRESKSAWTVLVGRQLTIDRVGFYAASGEERNVFESGEAVEIRIFLTAAAVVRQAGFAISVSDKRGGPLLDCSMLERDKGLALNPGPHVVTCRIASLPLSPGAYEVWLAVYEPATTAELIQWSRAGAIRIRLLDAPLEPGAAAAPWRYAPLRVTHHWALDGD
jgi:ABC-type polysaccharide/polyol phosphate transport system ATPase subunit